MVVDEVGKGCHAGNDRVLILSGVSVGVGDMEGIKVARFGSNGAGQVIKKNKKDGEASPILNDEFHHIYGVIVDIGSKRKDKKVLVKEGCAEKKQRMEIMFE
ncbi:hypothetical protein ACOSQ4_004805 [Xanthoceras sorbifolium]